MTTTASQLQAKCQECIGIFEDGESRSEFWYASGWIAAKLEDHGLGDLSTAIMRAGREFDANTVCYLLEQAKARL